MEFRQDPKGGRLYLAAFLIFFILACSFVPKTANTEQPADNMISSGAENFEEINSDERSPAIEPLDGAPQNEPTAPEQTESPQQESAVPTISAIEPNQQNTPTLSQSSSQNSSQSTAQSVSGNAQASSRQSTTLAPTAVPGTVQNGSMATVSIVGKPNTEYSIAVYYSTKKSEAQGLESKVSGSDGTVSWTWKVGPNTKEGTHRIVISGGGQQVETSITTVR